MKKLRETWHLNLILLIVSLCVSFGIGEMLLRQYGSNYLTVYEEERSLLYRYDDLLGWFPRADSSSSFTGSRTISVHHNSRGFRDREHVAGTKQGIAVFGDSFVWGYDVEESERFTEHLRSRLPTWDIYNLGVSGYSTDQEYLLIKQQYNYYKPRLVVLIFCSDNDDEGNMTNSIGNGAYYKPLYKLTGNGIELTGVPVPKSLTYFARQYPILANFYCVRLIIKLLAPKTTSTVISPTSAILLEMNDYVRSRGSGFVVGLIGPHLSLEHAMKSQNIPFVRLDGAERYNDMGKHWTPGGHTTVAATIYEYLQKTGQLD